MIDDVQVSVSAARSASNRELLSRAPDLHLLFASKVFAVEGRFMARHVGMLLPPRGDRRCGANVETVNHNSLNARRRSPVNEKRFVPRRPISHVASRVVRLLSAATETVAATRPLASGIKWDFTGARCNFTTDTTTEEGAT